MRVVSEWFQFTLEGNLESVFSHRTKVLPSRTVDAHDRQPRKGRLRVKRV
jgi:hypothetical protein